MPRKEHPRDIAIANLRAAAPNFDNAETELLFKNYCVVLEYFSRPNHCGGIMNPSRTKPERRMLSNGKWVSWKDVPLKRVIGDAEGWIEEKVESTRRTEVRHKLHEGLSSKMRTPKCDIAPDHPNEYPATPYSACRAENAPSHAEPIKKLSEATGQDVEHMGTNTAWMDAYSVKNNRRVDQLDGRRKALKQRLGREHTQQDVPNHFGRGELMRWIQTHNPKQDRRAVEEVDFEDLDDKNRAAYVEHLCGILIQKYEEFKSLKEQKKRLLRRVRQERARSDLEAAVMEIDCDYDLTECKPFWRQLLGSELSDAKDEATNYNSCAQPHQPRTQAEKGIFIGDKIEYDCDQIRVMIARLVTYGDWTIEDFRTALPGINRRTLTDFLGRRGPNEGGKMRVYLLAWRFFRKRKLLNISLPGKPVGPKSNKRKKQPLTEQSVNVTSKLSGQKTVKGSTHSQPEPNRASKRMK